MTNILNGARDRRQGTGASGPCQLLVETRSHRYALTAAYTTRDPQAIPTRRPVSIQPARPPLYGLLPPRALDLTSARSRSISGITAFQLVVGTDSTVTVNGWSVSIP